MPMRISIRAKPGAKAARITDLDGRLQVAVVEGATDGRANRAIEKALARHFGVPPSRVRIVAGHTARDKAVEIDQD